MKYLVGGVDPLLARVATRHDVALARKYRIRIGRIVAL